MAFIFERLAVHQGGVMVIRLAHGLNMTNNSFGV